MTIDISTAKRRLAELEKQRAALAAEYQQQAAVAAAAAAAHRAAVALADLQGQPTPVARAIEMPELPDLGELDERIDALKAAIADAEQQAELEELDSLVDELEWLDTQYRVAMAGAVLLYDKFRTLRQRWDNLFFKANRLGYAVPRRPPGQIKVSTIARWLDAGAGGVEAAKAAAEEARQHGK